MQNRPNELGGVLVTVSSSTESNRPNELGFVVATVFNGAESTKRTGFCSGYRFHRCRIDKINWVLDWLPFSTVQNRPNELGFVVDPVFTGA